MVRKRQAHGAVAGFVVLGLVMASAVSLARAADVSAAPASGRHYACSIGITRVTSNEVHTLSARMKSVDACKSWGVDANHLDPQSTGYQLLVHDGEGKLVLKQMCRVNGVPLFGSTHSTFTCRDAS